MSKVPSIARNTIVQTLGKVVSIALGWVIVIMMTRTLGVDTFGTYTIITAYLQFFGVALDLGLVLVSSRLLAEAIDQEKVLSNLFTFRLVTAAAVLVLAPAVIWLFPYSLAVKQGVAVLTLSFFLAALIQVFTGFFQKELKMGRVLMGEILSRLVLIGFVWFATITGRGLVPMLFGVVAGAMANFTLLYLSARSLVRFKLAFDPDLWRTIWQRSWPLMTTIVLNLVYLKADTIILSLTRAEAEVGVYGAMYRIFEVLVTFPTMFAGLLLPVLAAARTRGDAESFGRLSGHGIRALVFAAVPMVVGIFFVAPTLASLFGPDFVAEGAGLLRLLVVANAAVFIGTYLSHLVVAVDAQRRMIWPFAITAIIGLAGYLIFIPRYGAYGAAGMTIVAETTIAILAYVVVKQVTSLSLPVGRSFGVALAASIPLALWLWLTPAWPLAVVIGVGALIYVSALYLLGGVTRELITSLVRPVNIA